LFAGPFQTVKQSVRQCLEKTAKKGLRSIAMPPLGVGKRFGYGRYTTALATMTAVQEFLRDKPDSLQVCFRSLFN
jgi:O-acetyl-ADP-ribose deacetylase (regulator of RNase III)